MIFRRLLLGGGGLYLLYLLVAVIGVIFGIRWIFGLYRQVIDVTLNGQ
jgi:hypothetical protein